MGSLKTYKPNQHELLTETLDEQRWHECIRKIVRHLEEMRVAEVELKYGFVMDRDTDGLPQGQDKTVGVKDLELSISEGLNEGIIERIGSSDFVFNAEKEDLMFMLCNDGDIHFSSTDKARVMKLGHELKLAGFVVYDHDGVQI